MTPLHVDRLAASNGIEWPRARQRSRWTLWALWWLALAGVALAAIVSG
jgi:hypothetical protein